MATRTIKVSLEELHIGFLQALAKERGTSIDTELGKMVARHLKAATAYVRSREENTPWGRPLRDIDTDYLFRLRRQGKSLREISRIVNEPCSTVHRRLKEPQEGEPRWLRSPQLRSRV